MKFKSLFVVFRKGNEVCVITIIVWDIMFIVRGKAEELRYFGFVVGRGKFLITQRLFLGRLVSHLYQPDVPKVELWFGRNYTWLGVTETLKNLVKLGKMLLSCFRKNNVDPSLGHALSM